MGLIFISHSSRDNAEAEAMRGWLATQGWSEVFLDLDPSAGLAPGQRWRDELRKAGESCSAVVVLVSPHWAASKWCLTEFLFAAQLGKEIFPVLIAPCAFSDLPIELTATYQFADISTPAIRAEGHERLRIGLQRAGLHPGAFGWPPKDEPNRPLFRGLRMLEEPDAAIFFGRDTQITKALDTIRRLRDGAPERMLVILGASGAGKSSFLRAGLLSRLKRDTERFLVLPSLRPGRAALTGPTGLQHALGLDGPFDGSTVAAQLARIRAPVVERLRTYASQRADGAATPPPTVILPIDQAEELFIAGDKEAAAAVAGIVDVINADANLLLLLTIRSDSFGLLQADPLLSNIPRLPFDLPRMPATALKEVIEGPTRLPGAGIAIDVNLTEQLIQDFEGADTLPLLAFTLERLVMDHGTDGRLELREYVEEMKGVGGAIRKAVEIAFAKAAEMPGLPRTRAELDLLAQRSFVPGLVRIDDAAAAPKRRVALRHRLPQESLPLIDCLIDQRLLVADTEGAEATVEVSHEAVLRHWRELAAWIAARRDELSLSERVTAAARDWRAAADSAKAEALVHRGERLRAAEKLLLWDDLRREMGDDAVAYIAACRDAETRAEAASAAQRRRQRRLRQWVAGLVAAAAIVTVLGALLVITGQRNLGRSQSLTLARTAERFAEEGDYVRALRLSILAAQDNWLMPTAPEGRVALSSNAQAQKLATEIRGHQGKISGATLSKDERRILTWSDDGTVRLWDAATGEQIGPALKHDDEEGDEEGDEESVLGAVFSKDETRILTWSADDTARLWDAATGGQIGPALKHDRSVLGAVFSEDESRILTWSDDGTARLWDAATGGQIGPPLKHDDEESVFGAAFSNNESRILTWSTDDTARLWDAATGRQIGPPLSHRYAVVGAAFSKDERRILTWGADGTARLWAAETGEQIGPALEHDGEDSVLGAVFSKDERRILTWGYDRTARLWTPETNEQIVLKHDGTVLGAMFSNDERHIVTWSGGDGAARLWDAETGQQIEPALKHDGAVLGAVFSTDEGRILTWSIDGSARVWNAATGEQIGPPLRHDHSVLGAMFSNGERHILTWSADGTARLWDAAIDGQVGPAFRHDDSLSGAIFSKDESIVLTWGDDNTARLWDAVTGKQIGPPLKHENSVYGAVFSQDESRILIWSRGTVRLWNTATGEQIGPSLKHDEGSVYGAVLANDEGRILTWSDDGTARLWDAATSAQIGPPLKHDNAVLGAVFSKDERRILTWSEDGTARLWDAAGAQIGPPLKHDDAVVGAVFLKDEGRILTWSRDGTARLWDAPGGQIGPALKHEDAVYGAVLSQDEGRILTWSSDGTARLWDSATGEQVGPPLKHGVDAPIYGAVFSKDEGRILTWSLDGTARLWDAATGKQIGQGLQHDDAVLGAAFSRDESRILTRTSDGTARLWDAATGGQIGPGLKHEDAVYGAVFSKDESRILTWSDDGTARLWDVKWALRDMAEPDFVLDLCREKLVGASVQVGATPSDADVLVGIRHISTLEAEAAPILRDRVGEDVCAPPPTTWATLFSLVSLPFLSTE
jgi:WD40 repeat protein